jgi:hypothetical protein
VDERESARFSHTSASGLLVSWAALVEALHLVSGAGQAFSTSNHTFNAQIIV